ncbi:MAG: hypothetical protein CME70_18965 [Halobacteriovorax sp.]|nr:hypothetical protein [Halobacteriovorax sp.]
MLDRYREWISHMSDGQADLMASFGYLVWCSLLVTGILSYGAGALIPMVLSFGLAGVLTASVYIH